MTDKELLELAAKAAGYELVWGKEYFVGKDKVDCTDMPYIKSKDIDDLDCYWNPLTDDGDALRLAVKLDLAVMPYPVFENPKHSVVASQRNLEHSRFEVVELYETDPYEATRRAIVRAAAEIGKTL